MANLQGDSNIDDQTSLVNFMTWAKHLTGNKSIVEDKVSQKATQEPSKDIKQDQDKKAEPKQYDVTAQTDTEVKEQDKVSSIPQVASTKATNNTVMPATSVPVPSRGNDQVKRDAQIPVISIAHKAGRNPEIPKSVTTVINQLDIDPQEEPKHSLASMTPTQRKLLQKVDPQLYEEHSAIPGHPPTTRHEPEEDSVAHNDVIDKSKDTVSEQNRDEINKEGRSMISKFKRADGLLDSIHAKKNYRPFQSRMQTGGSPHSQTPVLDQDLNSPRTEGNVRRGPMTYYEKKQKEYYPPTQQSTNSANTMLQDKNPNQSVRSPTKTASAGLNPQAAEYNLTQSVDTLANEAVNNPAEDFEILREALTKPNLHELVPSMEEQLEQYHENVTATPSTAEDAVDGSTMVETPQPKRDSTNSEKASNQSQDDSRSEKRLDLTPMLNVLGARTIKATETVASQESDDDELPIKTEDQEEAFKNDTQVLDQEKEIEANGSRTLVLKDLPYNSDYTLVQSVIEGSVILKMQLSEDKECAYVKLASHDDCRRIFELSGGSKIIKHKEKTHTVRLELSADPDDQDNVLDAYMECGATRAVEVEDIDLDLTMRALYQLGQGATSPRVIEAINDSYTDGARSVVFRFISIHDAVSFRSSLRRINGWGDKKTGFV